MKIIIVEPDREKAAWLASRIQAAHHGLPNLPHVITVEDAEQGGALLATDPSAQLMTHHEQVSSHIETMMQAQVLELRDAYTNIPKLKTSITDINDNLKQMESVMFGQKTADNSKGAGLIRKMDQITSNQKLIMWFLGLIAAGMVSGFFGLVFKK